MENKPNETVIPVPSVRFDPLAHYHRCGVRLLLYRDNPLRSIGAIMMFHVQDWAGNVMNWGEFDSFDDAWGAIMERCGDDEEAMGEYFAIETPKAGLREKRYLDLKDIRNGHSS